MRLRLVATALAAASLSLPAHTTAFAPTDDASPPADLTWLATGDSYSSGEGLPHPDIPANPPDQTCERATGSSTVGTPSRAYAAVARDVLNDEHGWSRALPELGFEFVACTGDISDDWTRRWNEGLGGERADLVTMSYGGNNIGFAGVVFACVGVSVGGGINFAAGAAILWSLNPALGCNVGEAEMKDRIDVLVGNKEGELADGALTLPRLYEQIANQAVNRGGHVVVTGYPNLVEESGKWTWRLLAGNRCHRIRRADAAMFRSVAGYLNQQIALAVQAADGKYNGVRFHWVDTSQVYENDTTGHHGLCTGSPWLNGLTAGTEGAHSGKAAGRVYRSFHPKQEGHDALGEAVADVIAGMDWSDLRRIPGEASIPAGFHGEWAGTVTPSIDAARPFETFLTIGGNRADIRIPVGGCDAQLIPYEATGTVVRLRTDDLTGNCVDGGSWQLTIVDAGTIRYEWFGPSSGRVDSGELHRPAAGGGWPTTAGLQGPSTLYMYMGTEFVFPAWVSCTDDDTVCIAGAGDKVRVYVTKGLRYVTSLPRDTPDPAAELRAIGASDSQVTELLSPSRSVR